jgi:hypothetical protein
MGYGPVGLRPYASTFPVPCAVMLVIVVSEKKNGNIERRAFVDCVRTLRYMLKDRRARLAWGTYLGPYFSI